MMVTSTIASMTLNLWSFMKITQKLNRVMSPNAKSSMLHQPVYEYSYDCHRKIGECVGYTEWSYEIVVSHISDELNHDVLLLRLFEQFIDMLRSDAIQAW